MKKTTFFKTILLAVILLVGTGISWAAYPGTGTFTKITDVSDLTDGYYVVAYGADFAMNNTNAGSFFVNTAIAPVANSIVNPDVSIVWEIKNHVDGGRTIFNEASSKYVSFTGTSNAAQAVASVTSGSQRWNIIYDVDVFKISNITSTTRLLQYNTTSPRFACYTGSQKNITLYKLAASSCTPSNLAFANPTVSKLATDASFIVTATSVNASTAITYSSDNLAVATVNATTGEVTLIGAGEAKITATQVAGTHNSVDYCAASASYNLTVSSATPTITITDITELVLQTTVGDTDSETMQVNAINMTNDVILSITGTDAAMFSVTPASITPSSGTVANAAIVINYSPTTPGNHTATLNIASTGAETVTRSLSGSSTWAPLAKPVLTGATNVDKTALTLNWDVVNGATSYEVNVYSKAGGGSQNVLTENFDKFIAGTPDASANGTDVAGTLNTYTQTSGWTGSKVYQAGGTAKMGSSSALGYLVTPTIDLSANSGVFNISFKAMAWSGDATDLKIYLNDILVSTVSGMNNDATYTLGSFSVDLTGGTSTSKIKFEGKQASKGRFFIEDLVISQGGSSVTPVSGSPFTVTTNSKDLTGLTAATDYYYTVKAKNANVSSEVSEEQKVSTLATSVYSPSGKLQLRIVNGQAIFEASANQIFEVYNSVGQKLVSTRTAEGLNKLSINAKGVVIIKIDNEIVKVVL